MEKKLNNEIKNVNCDENSFVYFAGEIEIITSTVEKLVNEINNQIVKDQQNIKGEQENILIEDIRYEFFQIKTLIEVFDSLEKKEKTEDNLKISKDASVAKNKILGAYKVLKTTFEKWKPEIAKEKVKEIDLQFFAHKKGGGSTKNGRDSQAKRLGVKAGNGKEVTAGSIIIRQKGTRFYPGKGAGIGKDYTIFALVNGQVEFINAGNKKFVNIIENKKIKKIAE